MDINNHHQQQQQPGTLANVLSVSDINDNELTRITDDRQDVAWGVEAVDNGEGGMMVVVGEVPDPAQENIVIADIVCENYDIDAAYNDVW